MPWRPHELPAKGATLAGVPAIRLPVDPAATIIFFRAEGGMAEFRIASIVQGSGADGGRSVYFDAVNDDGERLRLLLHPSTVGAAIVKLQAFAGLARKDRVPHARPEGPAREYEETTLLVPQGIEVCATADGGAMAGQV